METVTAGTLPCAASRQPHHCTSQPPQWHTRMHKAHAAMAIKSEHSSFQPTWRPQPQPYMCAHQEHQINFPLPTFGTASRCCPAPASHTNICTGTDASRATTQATHMSASTSVTNDTLRHPLAFSISSCSCKAAASRSNKSNTQCGCVQGGNAALPHSGCLNTTAPHKHNRLVMVRGSSSCSRCGCPCHAAWLPLAQAAASKVPHISRCCAGSQALQSMQPGACAVASKRKQWPCTEACCRRHHHHCQGKPAFLVADQLADQPASQQQPMLQMLQAARQQLWRTTVHATRR